MKSAICDYYLDLTQFTYFSAMDITYELGRKQIKFFRLNKLNHHQIMCLLVNLSIYGNRQETFMAAEQFLPGVSAVPVTKVELSVCCRY